MSNPFFSFFPALPLSKTLRLGDWCIGTPGADVPWRSARFKELALAHVASFAKEGFKDGAWMWHHAHGFDGSMPEPEVWAAIRATMCFVALDANDHVRDDPNAANRLATSENAGFEALSGQSKTHLCGQFLRKLFEDTTRPHAQLLPWAGLLWSPNERTDLARSWMKNGVPQPVIRSELEDWFAAFGEQRNAIIHEGTLSSHVYEAPPERPLSRYAGPLFWTADRLLREAVKALLGADVLLCARLQDVEDAKKFLAIWDEMTKAQASADTVPEPTETFSNDGDVMPKNEPNRAEEDASAGAARDLVTLLAELGCDAANKVQLAKVAAQPASTEEGAEENARAARGWWSASFEKRSMLINRAERAALETAPAEFPLPRHWRRCE